MARRPTSVLGAGLLISGASTYAFLLIAGRGLGDAAYAPLGALWSLIFIVCPGLFSPIEQETSRATAALKSKGIGTRQLAERALAIVVGLAVLSVIVIAATYSLLDNLFKGQTVLVLALLPSMFAFGFIYWARGLFAGSQMLRAYGFLLGCEGVIRCLLAVAICAVGATTAGPYALALAGAPLITLLIALPTLLKSLAPGAPVPWRDLTPALGRLIIAAFCSQALINLGPLVVTYLLPLNEQDRAGAFTKALIITRIPLFLFQAVQAVMLPRLVSHGEHREWPEFKRLTSLLVGGVAVLGIVGALGLTAAGGLMLRLFGSVQGLPAFDFFLLGMANLGVLLAMTFSQPLIALRRQGSTTVGWAVGLVAFCLCLALPVDVIRRVEISLLVGSFVAVAAMAWLTVSAYRRATSNQAEDARVTS